MGFRLLLWLLRGVVYDSVVLVILNVDKEWLSQMCLYAFCWCYIL